MIIRITAFTLVFMLSCTNHEIGGNHVNNNSEETATEDSVILNVNLVKTTVFGSNEDHFLDGYIGDFEIDQMGRVYIVSTNMQSVGISVFDANGDFIKKIGRKGRGPGDFGVITDIVIRDNELHIFDFQLKRISVYELQTFSLLRIILLDQDRALPQLREISMIHVNSDGSYVLGFIEPQMMSQSDSERIMYLRQRDSIGVLLPYNPVEFRLPDLFTSEERPGPGVPLPFTMPFSRKTLIDFSDQDEIYIVWSENLEINVLNKNGDLLHEISKDIEKPELDIHALDINRTRISVLNNYDIPQTWPALFDMNISDNKLWIATFSNQAHVFNWFVFDLHTGKKIASFNHKSKHTNLEPGQFRSKKVKIRNGYFYEHEHNFSDEIDRIVKSRIHFTEN